MTTNTFSSSTATAHTTSGDVVRQIAVITAYIATIVINALANIVPIGGRTTGELSDLYEVFFVPAGYVFSIWSLIYLGLGAYAIYQALPAQRGNPRLRAMGWLFVISCIFNSAWIFIWHYQLVSVSLLVMLGILITLIGIYTRLAVGYDSASYAEKITTHWTFRVYLGWITVATIANVTTFLNSVGYEGAPLTPALWAAVMLVIATVIGLSFALGRCDVAYTLVLIWAFVGIFVKFPSTPTVAYTALTMAALLAVAAVVGTIRSFRWG